MLVIIPEDFKQSIIFLQHWMTQVRMDYKNTNNHSPHSTNTTPLFPMAVIIGALLVVIILLKVISPQKPSTYIDTQPLPVIASTDTDNSQPLAEKAPTDFTIVTVKNGDTLTGIFLHNHIPAHDLQSILSLPVAKKHLVGLQANATIKLAFDKQHQLQSMTYQTNTNKILEINRDVQGFHAKFTDVPSEKRMVTVTGTIHGSLYSAGKQAGLPTKITMQLASIFGNKIDFARDLKTGDTFKVVYTVDYQGNQPIHTEDIAAAELTTHKQTYKAVRYKMADHTVGYFSPDGENMQKAFLRTPIKYKRISDPYSPHRKHPILHTIRPHWGVDLAAPSGTPVKASSDGRIVFIGKKGGYGNMIQIYHGNQITTVYGHLKRFAKHMHRGSRVKKGQTIAYVGSTGLATGPHLHYEYRIRSHPVDPMTVKLPDAHAIPAHEQAAFLATAQGLIEKLDANPTAYARLSLESTQKTG